ncbi:hypothetical protein V2W45_1254669, partial [Cenococcum geophilum]
IPQKKLLLYYIKNPPYLCRYAKIYKPLKDIIIEIAKRSKLEVLEDLLEKLLGGRSHRRKKNYTINGAPKKHKV